MVRSQDPDAGSSPAGFIPGLAVGHAEVPGGGSGCTVILGPFRARIEKAGLATGSRELDTLSGDHVAPVADAVLLTGGSAFGLAAAQGVVAWLEGHGRGHPTTVTPVPIVAAAVLYDLKPGRSRPGVDEGRRACENASVGAVPEGRVGAGAGAMVGKLAGRERGSPGGLGATSARIGDWTVGAIVAVNAVGEILDRSGKIVAGVRGPDGSVGEAGFLDGVQLALAGEAWRGPMSPPPAGENTTLALVGTDAPLGSADLKRVARLASTALARRISPVHTPFDGDLVFAVSTAAEAAAVPPLEVMRIGLAAREMLETAILRAVAPDARA
jgi:L-aminopeptidase/D-esterase-like protein